MTPKLRNKIHTILEEGTYYDDGIDDENENKNKKAIIDYVIIIATASFTIGLYIYRYLQ